MMRFDSKGRIHRMDPSGVSGIRDARGALLFAPRRIKLADAVVNADPATHLSAAITDSGEGVGLSFPLNGTWASTEITDDAPYFTCQLVDVFGRPVGGDVALSTTLMIMSRTVPAVTDMVKFGVMIHNERDWRTATVDGSGTAVQFNLTNPNAQGTTIVNGATTVTTSSAFAGIVGAVGAVSRVGQNASNTQQWLGCLNYGVDANFDTITSAVISRAAANGTGPGTGPLYITTWAARTNAANVTNFTALFDAWHTPILVTGRPA